MGIAIKVENLSKAYQLGEIGTGTLSNDLKRWAYKVRGKEDPFLKIGETNDRTKKGESDMVWSLKDLNFEIEQGDAVGIIGRNGAGKSTLLKILSRVTSPTTGSVKVKGRVASLLEVGTGFHPELSGRDNIFLNGAILGMRKAEIKKHFDAIVDFAGVERYIDTPVKRYSSGMYVRLAFAVAAHLESEILIVDEVLAVGDAEFQKKCLGKMNDVSKGEGRTVLFVSHNMTSISALCKKAMLLKNGGLEVMGGVVDVTEKYLQTGLNTQNQQNWEKGYFSNSHIDLLNVSAFAEGKKLNEAIKTNDNLKIEIEFENLINNSKLDITLDMYDNTGVHVCHIGTLCSDENGLGLGCYKTIGLIPKNILNTNRYSFNILFGLNQREALLEIKDVLTIDIEDGITTRGNNYIKFPGIIHPIGTWETKKHDR